MTILNSEKGGCVNMVNQDKKKHALSKLRREVPLLPGYLVLTLWSLITLLMIGWVFCASLSTTAEIFGGKVGTFSSGIHFGNYVKAWSSQNVSKIFMNSLLYTSISVVVLIFVCAPAAYALSRYRFPGSGLLQSGLVSAMAVPVAMIILPLFCMVAQWGLIDNGIKNRLVLIYLYIGINVPYTTIFLMTFFSNLSSEYEDAAAIDGCGPVKAFWKIMFPLAQPGIITVTIFNFNKIWNEYFLSLIFANSDTMRPVAVGLFSMINSMKYTGDWAGLFAAVVIVTLPTLVLYLFMSERIISGITAGGVKG